MESNKKHSFNSGSRKAIFTLFFLAIACFVGGQTTVLSGDSENEYSKVTRLYTKEVSNIDSVVVSNPALFTVDDIVMLYHPKGFDFDPLTGEQSGYFSMVGKYALLTIGEIKSDTIIFNASTKMRNPADGGARFEEGAASQLIKVPQYKNAKVEGVLTAPAWDSASGTGGVLALYVKNKLVLDGDISMSGKGFRGADPGGDVYGGACLDTNTLKLRYFLEGDMDKAGRLGEGPVLTSVDTMRGFGRLITAGGGGSGMYAGGGGGSNYEKGGEGGGSFSGCLRSALVSTNAEGGQSLFSRGLYTNDPGDPGLYLDNKLFFGGGGGTGTQDPGYPAIQGGNGGGIVLIVADTLESNLGSGIYADGDSVTVESTGAGGGGGGGGVIVLEINGTIGTVGLSANGGKGGDTNPTNGDEYTGPGGGGGGGLYWLTTGDGINVVKKAVDGGKYNGNLSGSAYENGKDGHEPETLLGLVAPLYGFLFNTLPENKTVCSDVIPPTIVGSQPKGGDGAGTYSYRWIQSTDNLSWTDAAGVNTNKDYEFTVPLTITTYYNRVVSSGTVVDSSNVPVSYTVVPAITDNVIASPDTICKGLSPHALASVGSPAGATIGVDGLYRWQSKGVDETDWTTVASDPTIEPYQSGALDTTTYFRREVTSSVCVSHSNEIEIEVLEPLTNLSITSKDTLCNGQVPEFFDGATPLDGDQNRIWYSWEVSSAMGGPFTQVGVEEDYTELAALTADAYYRRIVYSGRDSTCISSPEVFKVEVLDLIGGNVIVTSDDTICRGSTLADAIATETALSGGDGAYSYTWEINPDGAGWTSLPTTSTDEVYDGPFNAVSTELRRVVISGKADVCKDTAYLNEPVITIPVITNNAFISVDTFACEGVEINRFRTSHPGGGKNASYDYQWQWADPSGAFSDIVGAVEENYQSAPLSSSKEFRRIVHSSAFRTICSDTSTAVLVDITPMIEGNLINGGEDGEFCSDLGLSINGSTISGGDTSVDPDYVWYSGKSVDNVFDAEGGNTISYNDAAYNDTLYFLRVVNRGVCSDTSSAVQMWAINLPEADMTMLSAEKICEGDDAVEFDVVLRNRDPRVSDYDLRLTYVSDVEGSGTVDLSAASLEDHFSIFVSPETNAVSNYDYTLVSITNDKACTSTNHTTNHTTIEVNAIPEVEITSTVSEVCGPEVDLSATATGGGHDGWYISGLSSAENMSIFSDTSASLTTATISFEQMEESKSVWYKWRRVAWETPLKCGATDSIQVVHYREPGNSFLVEDAYSIPFASTMEIEAEEPDAGNGLWTVLEGSGGTILDGSMPLASVEDLVVGEDHQFLWTVTNGVCGPYHDTLKVFVSDLQFFDAFSPNGDDQNPYLGVGGLDNAAYVQMSIFNGSGVMVREIVANDNATVLSWPEMLNGSGETARGIWDGMNQDGNLCEDGVYYFKIQVGRYSKEAEFTYQGRFLLKTGQQD